MNERFDLDTATEWRMMGCFAILVGLISLVTWAWVRELEALLVMLGGFGLFWLVILPPLWLRTRQRFNYAELRDDHLHVRRMGYVTSKLAYSEIAGVKLEHEHSLFYAFSLAKQGVVFGKHIDVTEALPSGLGQAFRLRRIGAARGLHIAVREPERFLDALQHRLDTRAGTPPAPNA